MLLHDVEPFSFTIPQQDSVELELMYTYDAIYYAYHINNTPTPSTSSFICGIYVTLVPQA